MAEERSVDTDRPADEAWILSVQSKLYQWSKAYPSDAWRDLWGWMTDIRTLRCAWRRVASNKGKRSAGAAVPNTLSATISVVKLGI
jgi:RNA-directed DNA polymerase